MAGAMGQQGQQGPQGPAGPQGPKGDPGSVTVADGGAIFGPAGPQGPAGTSVQIQTLAAGDSSCPQGGVRLTAGTAVTVVCNGAQGATGPQGAQGAAGPQGPTGAQGATGPQGPAGPQGPKGNPGSGSPSDAGAGQATPITLTPLAAGDPNCAHGGVSVVAGTATTYVCNGAPGTTGPQGAQGAAGPQGPTGAQGVAGPPGTTGPQGPAGATGPAGGTGPQGATGATGPQGPAGATGPQGPAGTAGTAAGIASVSPGNAGCPYGGTMFSSGGTTSYACNGGPVNSGSLTLNGGIPPVTFAGYTPTTYGGNLGGRAGAHALCAAAFAGSHFCADWEIDQADPPPMSVNAWVDPGNNSPSTRWFRAYTSTIDYNTCGGWTSSSANYKPNGNLATGSVFTTLSGNTTSYVGPGDGGCENPLPLVCCSGGTAVRFRGFTPSTSGGNLGGRLGANATCAAAFSGSHFCTNWEADQAAIPAPIPASGAWVDEGNADTTLRRFHAYQSTADYNTCGGWTSSTANYKPNGNLATGIIFDSIAGGTLTSYVGTNDGGCENARPIACCDGYPPL
jgi:hypothetical protein